MDEQNREEEITVSNNDGENTTIFIQVRRSQRKSIKSSIFSLLMDKLLVSIKLGTYYLVVDLNYDGYFKQARKKVIPISLEMIKQKL
jgi:hypothetical protein